MSATPPVLRQPSELTPARVESLLRRAGALHGGGVSAVEVVEDRASTWAGITRVRVAYAAGSAGECPAALLLKRCAGTFGPSEVHYYTRDYVGLADAPLVRCFAAAFDPGARAYHLLLDDLSGSHVNGDHRAPSREHAVAIGEAFGVLHAHRWGEPRLAELGERAPTPGDVARHLAAIAAGVEPLIEAMGDALAPAWAVRLRRIVAHMPERYVARARDTRALTLLHGDPNPGNLLVPKDAPGPLLLIDRQPFDDSITAWSGTLDLVAAIVPWWEPEARRRFERDALGAWHRTLCARGAGDPGADFLVGDYRFFLTEGLATPLRWCADPADRERMRWLWTRQLERAMAAWDDWACDGVWR